MRRKTIKTFLSALLIAVFVGSSTLGLAAADLTKEEFREEISIESKNLADSEDKAEAVEEVIEEENAAANDDTAEEELTEDRESEEESVLTDEISEDPEKEMDILSGEASADLTLNDSSEAEEDPYVYVYAGLSWNEFWASEGVYAAGNTSSSDEKDTKGELDKGGFDSVSRATVNHGLHRGSFQSMATIYDEEGKTYEVSHWSRDGKTIYLTDGSSIGWARGTITKADGSTAYMDFYQVTGMKYIPVAVRSSDFEAFKSQYRLVNSGEDLVGGYSEMNLKAYEKKADVTADTNGLKYAARNADGSFSFTARKTGSTSGLANESLKTAENVNLSVKEASGAYGEFLRVDFNGDGYGDLGSAMYAVKWTYYGSQSEEVADRQPLAAYGTKFAADNWMHKAMGIQLGLTQSARCQLPTGTDGSGYWSVTIYAMGYEDYTVNFSADASNIVMPEAEEVDTQALKAAISQAETYHKDNYTTASWTAMQLELDEAKEAVEKASTQALVDEALTHLKNAISSLVEKMIPKLVLTSKNVTYNGKAQKIDPAKRTGSSGNISYQYYSDPACKKAVSAANVKNAGTYYVKASLGATENAQAAESNVAKLTIKKATVSITAKTTAKTYKAAILKKKAQSFNMDAAASSKSKIKYSVTKKSSNVSVSGSGKVTVKKGAKKGTYKLQVKITAAASANYAAAAKTLTLKIIVK